MTEPVHSDGTFAGYRLVRKLAIGSRASVYLGAGSTGTVALKIFDSALDRDSVGREIEALGRLESPHLVRLLDLASTGDETPSLVMERIRGGSVATLLRERNTLERGEVVTLLAPLARLVTELQLAGVAHGNLSAASIHLGDSGAPILLGLGHATLFAAGAPPAALDHEPAAAADRAALGTLALRLLERVRDAEQDARATGFAQWIQAAPGMFEFPAALEERLFDWAEAMPIAFAHRASLRQVDAALTVPARVGPAADPATPPEQHEPEPAAVSHGWFSAELLENPLAELRRRATRLVHGVRRRYWIAAGGIVVALVLALSLLPPGDSPPAQRAAVRTSTPTPSRTTADLPDDPLLALPLLLKARATCFHDLSVLCLDDVDEASSSAFSGDAAAIQRVQQGGEVTASGTESGDTASLVERLGDSALLSLGAEHNPASVLMIRSEAGWRIRDFLTGKQATHSSPAPSG
jgi:eukaryotic-like serine/threonine-protein kinase